MIDQVVDKRQPYPGPRPFTESEGDLFFGRIREENDLVSRIISHKIVLLYAESGVGKSSLLNAKVIPQLKENDCDVLPVARFSGLERPDEIKNVYTFSALISWTDGKHDMKALANLSLNDFLGTLPHKKDKRDRPLLRIAIFDQFEEMFSLYPSRYKEREDFFKVVSEALESDPLLRVLFVIREDYLAQLDDFAKFLPDGLRTRYRLSRLSEDAARSAIENPLKVETVWPRRSYDAAAISKLIEELRKVHVIEEGRTIERAGEFIEPVLLQVVCEKLWNSIPEHVDTIEERHIDALKGIDKALREFYDNVLDNTVKEFHDQKGLHKIYNFFLQHFRERKLRAFCEEALITPASTRGTIFKGETETNGIPNRVVDFMKEKHLIRAEPRAGATWYELTHDRLIKPLLESKKERKNKRKKILIAAAVLASLGVFLLGILGPTYYLDKKSYTALRIEEIGAIERNAQEYFLQKNYNEAIGEYNKAIAKYKNEINDKRHSSLYIDLGNVYFQKRDYEKAIEYYQKAFKIDPQNPNSYIEMGNAFLSQNKYDEAVRSYRKAIDIDLNNPGLYDALGNVLLSQNKYDEAVKSYQTAIDIDPKNTNAYIGIGNARAHQRNYSEAVKNYKLAINNSPVFTDIYYRIGDALSNMGGTDNEKDALDNYQKAINSDPSNANAYIGLGSMYTKLEQYPEAIEVYKKALKIKLQDTDADQANNANAYIGLGYAYTKTKPERYPEAIEAYKEALNIKLKNPDADKAKNANAYYGLGNALLGNLLGKMNYREAEEYYQKSIGSNPDKKSKSYALAYVGAGYAIKAQGRDEAEQMFDKAKEIYEKAIEVFNKNNKLVIDAITKVDMKKLHSKQ